MVKHFALLVFVHLEEIIVPALFGILLAVKLFNDMGLDSKMTLCVTTPLHVCSFSGLSNHQSENSELKLSHPPLSSAPESRGQL